MNILLIKESWKISFHKNIKIDNNINIDSNKKKSFLSTKSASYNDFWSIMWHWSNGCYKFGFALTGINYILKHIILNFNNISQYYFCFYYIIDKINAA